MSRINEIGRELLESKMLLLQIITIMCYTHTSHIFKNFIWIRWQCYELSGRQTNTQSQKHNLLGGCNVTGDLKNSCYYGEKVLDCCAGISRPRATNCNRLVTDDAIRHSSHADHHASCQQPLQHSQPYATRYAHQTFHCFDFSEDPPPPSVWIQSQSHSSESLSVPEQPYLSSSSYEQAGSMSTTGSTRAVSGYRLESAIQNSSPPTSGMVVDEHRYDAASLFGCFACLDGESFVPTSSPRNSSHNQSNVEFARVISRSSENPASLEICRPSYDVFSPAEADAAQTTLGRHRQLVGDTDYYVLVAGGDYTVGQKTPQQHREESFQRSPPPSPTCVALDSKVPATTPFPTLDLPKDLTPPTRTIGICPESHSCFAVDSRMSINHSSFSTSSVPYSAGILQFHVLNLKDDATVFKAHTFN